jgi:mannan endo-1,4-beta-mannosidase
MNIDSVEFIDMRRWIREVYQRGGVNTFTWQIQNPVSEGDSRETTPAVRNILPGGSAHEVYLEKLDDLALFATLTKSPMIFRPFHSHNDDLFWWGKGNCTERDFIQLWQFTVDYLRDVKKVHNFIYVFSPDRSAISMDRFVQDYLYGYPGNEYVDVLGLTDYIDAGNVGNDPIELQIQNFTKSLNQLDKIAKGKQKLAAVTATGQLQLTDSLWFSRHLLEPLNRASEANIAWILLGQNRSEDVFYAPFDGHNVTEDFRGFRNDKTILFENDLESIYKKN